MSTPYSRIRFKSSPIVSSLTEFKTLGNPIGTYPDTVSSLTNLLNGESVEYMGDVVTPDWHLKRRRGEIVNNPLSLTRRNISYANAELIFTTTHPMPYNGYGQLKYVGQYGAVLDYNSSVNLVPAIRSTSVAPVVIDEEHFIKLAAIKARTGISPILVQSLVSAVELPKTLNLIRSSINTLRQIRKSVVTGNPDYALRAIGNQRGKKKVRVDTNFSRKTAENRWLEFRYGWTPLVFEIQGAIKALNRAQVGKPIRATSRGFEKTEASNSFLHIRNGGAGNGIQEYRYTRKKTLSVRAYVLYTADLKHQQARDFGVSELPLAMWELVPYSFVVDWFVNIGDWIEALTPKLGINILAEGYTIKTSHTLTRVFEKWTKVIAGGASNDVTGSYIGAEDKLSESTYNRVPHLGVLYSLPPFNVKIDKKRVLDAIALLGRTV